MSAGGRKSGWGGIEGLWGFFFSFLFFFVCALSLEDVMRTLTGRELYYGLFPCREVLDHLQVFMKFEYLFNYRSAKSRSSLKP